MSEEIEQKTKQSFTKMATTKKRKKKRTWVIVYRYHLVDGPPVNLAKSDAAQKRKRKAKKKAKDSE